MNLFFAIIFFAILLSLVEVVKRFFNLPSEFSRKVAHIASAISVFFLPYFLNKWQIIILASLFILLLGFSKYFNILKSLHSVSRKTWGEMYLPAGVGITSLLFLPNNLVAFQFGILVMGLSDGLAGILGKRFGKYSFSILGASKTYFGSLIFFVTTFFIFLFFVEINISSFVAALLVSLILAFIEAILKYGTDNLIIPIVGGYILILSLYFLG